MRKELFEELMESVNQATAIERGEMKPSRPFKLDPKNDVVKARGKLGLCFLDKTNSKYHISLRIQKELALTQHYFFSPLAVFSLTVRW